MIGEPIGLTTTVKAVTTAGKSGSMWLKEGPDGDAGRVEAYVYHTDSGAPTASTVLDRGKRIFEPIGNNDMMIFSADNGSDIYYACMKNTGDTAELLVDEV